jgi:adhesin transport system membrane fusion protein
MLNISNNKVYESIVNKKYATLDSVLEKQSSKVLKRMIIAFLIILLCIFFLPWTQNVRSNGVITTLKPDQKPQGINSIIDGRIEKWFVQEGDFVNKGDTILKISEVKDSYFDGELLNRTKNQVDLKKQSVQNYTDKVDVQTNQIQLLAKEKDLKILLIENKLEQVALKVQNDSINHLTALLNNEIAKKQYDRTKSLYEQGLKSKSNLEEKGIKLQQTLGYEIGAKNKWLNSKNDLIGLKIELSNVTVKFKNDVNKMESSIITTKSQKIDVESNLNKLENTYSNYSFRNGLYYITAPKSGYITKTITSGIGEIIKAGKEILTLMPSEYDLAVEMYINPIDLPLVHKGEKVRIQFDGWPSIVFSGWPNTSFGTFGGEIYAIDQYIGANGKYRVLIKSDENDKKWPEALRFGTGTSNLIMLNDVPIWYELWRNINGFPSEFYTVKNKEIKKKK